MPGARRTIELRNFAGDNAKIIPPCRNLGSYRQGGKVRRVSDARWRRLRNVSDSSRANKQLSFESPQETRSGSPGPCSSRSRRPLFCPTEVWSHVCAALAAGLADELLFDVGQTEIVGPLIRANRLRVRALVILAIDHDTAHAHVAHIAETDFLVALSHRQSISASRIIAGLFRFLTLIQCFDLPA